MSAWLLLIGSQECFLYVIEYSLDGIGDVNDVSHGDPVCSGPASHIQIQQGEFLTLNIAFRFVRTDRDVQRPRPAGLENRAADNLSALIKEILADDEDRLPDVFDF